MDWIVVFFVMVGFGILSYYFHHVGSAKNHQEIDQPDSQQILTSEIQTEPNRGEDEKTQFAQQVEQMLAEKRAERQAKWSNSSGNSGGNWEKILVTVVGKEMGEVVTSFPFISDCF